MSSSFATDTPYTWGYYKELNPVYLNYVCALNGHFPIDIEKEFTYCDLGCGFGVTTNALAALFPHAQFTGIDYNEKHVAEANELANDSGCTNVDFLALDFNKLAEAKLPQFDFIVLHGVYSWVDPSTRESIRKFIADHLNEDGIVYVSYDCLPGWAALSPLRDIAMTHTAGMLTDEAMKAQASLDYLDFMSKNNAAFFVDNPPAREFLEEIKTKDIQYVAHELFVDFSKPYYFHQVAAELRSAGPSYSGSAQLHLNFIDLAVPPEFHEILLKANSRIEFESRGDFIRNQRFRKDVFKNNRKTMDETEQQEVLSNIVFGATCLQPDFLTFAAFGDVKLNYGGRLFSGLINALCEEPMTAQEIISTDQFKDQPLDLVIDALKFLSAGGQLVPLARKPKIPAVQNTEAEHFVMPSTFNIQLLKRRLMQQQAIVFISSTTGIGLEVSMADALFALCLAEAAKEDVPGWVFQRLLESNQKMVFEDGTEKEAIAAAVVKFREIRLPKFLELGILAPLE